MCCLGRAGGVPEGHTWAPRFPVGALNRRVLSTSVPDRPSRMIEHLVAHHDITTVFQPIVDLNDGRVIGYEGLTRGPAGSALENPRLLFAAAEQAGLLRELENACWDRALHSAAAHSTRRGDSAKLFLNVL